MAAKKNGEDKNLKIKGTNIKVSEKQLSAAKKKVSKSVKSAARRAPKKYRKVAAIAAVAIVALFTFLVDRFIEPIKYIPTNFSKFSIAPLGENQLKIHFIDVGQGDSMIIQFPDSTNMIIDGGDTRTSTYTKVIRYAKSLNIKTFDYMLLTHTDSDHVGGLDDVASVFEVKKVFMPYIEKGLFVTKAYENFLKAIDKPHIEIDYSNFGDSITSSDESNQFIMAFLSPDSHMDGENLAQYGEYYELNEKLKISSSGHSKQKNDVSAITLIDYLGVKVFLSGDANIPVENKVVDRINGINEYITSSGDTSLSPFKLGGKDYVVDLDVDLVKAGHHGSRDSTGDYLLEVLRPEYAVISLGEGNSYGHPHIELLQRLHKYMGAENIYRTDLHGDIIATISPSTSGEKGTLTITAQKDLAVEVSAAVSKGGKTYIVLTVRRAPFQAEITKITA